MGLWLQPRDQTAVISVKRKHMCMPEGGRSGQEHDQECAHCFCLFACLLFVFQLSTLCSTVMSCDLPRKTSDAKCDTCHCASTQFTWRRQEAFGHVYTAIPPPPIQTWIHTVLSSSPKQNWSDAVLFVWKNRMHPKCGNANDKNWNSTERSTCSRRLRYFHYTSLISVRTYCDFTC